VNRADRGAVGDAAQEIETLAALLAEVVQLAEDLVNMNAELSEE
jgi:hypothetical protein